MTVFFYFHINLYLVQVICYIKHIDLKKYICVYLVKELLKLCHTPFSQPAQLIEKASMQVNLYIKLKSGFMLAHGSNDIVFVITWCKKSTFKSPELTETSHFFQIASVSSRLHFFRRSLFFNSTYYAGHQIWYSQITVPQ